MIRMIMMATVWKRWHVCVYLCAMGHYQLSDPVVHSGAARIFDGIVLWMCVHSKWLYKLCHNKKKNKKTIRMMHKTKRCEKSDTISRRKKSGITKHNSPKKKREEANATPLSLSHTHSDDGKIESFINTRIYSGRFPLSGCARTHVWCAATNFMCSVQYITLLTFTFGAGREAFS